jgi:hypothetical protein
MRLRDRHQPHDSPPPVLITPHLVPVRLFTPPNYFKKSFFRLTQMDQTSPCTCVHSWAITLVPTLRLGTPVPDALRPSQEKNP